MNLGRAEYDWNDKTEGIPALGGRDMAVPGGKMLGGSSGLNFAFWDRGSRAEYDAWARFGGDGWSFDALLPYFQKCENARSVVTNPNPILGVSTSVVGDTVTGSAGNDGPIKLTYNDTDTDVQGVFVQTWNALGVPTRANPVCFEIVYFLLQLTMCSQLQGNKRGVVNVLRAIDADEGKRVTSASAYLPLANSDNLKVLLGAQVRCSFVVSVSCQQLLLGHKGRLRRQWLARHRSPRRIWCRVPS